MSILRADPDDRPAARRKAASRRSRRAPSRRRSLLGTLVYWGVVLGVWGVVALGGLFAYYASQLPPIDQLAVPKRPPNIADPRRRRLAARQSRRHRRRRRCASAICRPICPRPSSPSRTGASTTISASIRSAFRARVVARRRRRRRHAGRLDADPAARQEPVPDAGAHARRASSRRRSWRSGSSANIRRTRSSNSISTASISAPAPMASRRRRGNISARAPRT